MSITKDKEWECLFCGEPFANSGKAKEHIKDEHADDVLDEEWPRYFKETEGDDNGS